MFEIKIIDNKIKLKEVYTFFEDVFKDYATKNNEIYYDMKDRYNEMLRMFDTNKNFLLYIEDNDQVVAALVCKNLDIENKKIVLSVLAVKEEYRNKGLARMLINEIENRCKKENIKYLSLGARYNACKLYESLNYIPSLMVQIYDNNIDNIRKNNIYNLKEIESYQCNDYGYIIYKVNEIKKEYIDCFMNNISNSYVQYIFKKDLRGYYEYSI